MFMPEALSSPMLELINRNLLECTLADLERTYARSSCDVNMKAMLGARASINYFLTHRAEQRIQFARQTI